MCLTVLKKMAPIISFHGDEVALDKFDNLMEGFRRVLQKRSFKILVMLKEYIQLLVVMCKHKNLAERIWLKNGAKIIEDLALYLKHECVVIRLLVANHIDLVFQAYNDCTWEKQVFDVVKESTVLDDYPTAYEKQSRISNCLLSFAKVFSSTKHIRKQVAFSVIQFIYLQDCDPDAVNGFLHMCSTLLEVNDVSKYFRRHLKYLLKKWIKGGQEIKKFPFGILKHHEFEKFLWKNLDVIGAVCFLERKTDELKFLSQTLKWSEADILEEAYPIFSYELTRPLRDDLQVWVSQEKEQELQLFKVAKMVAAGLREFSISDFATQKRESFIYELAQQSSEIQKILLLLEEDIVESIVDEDRSLSFEKYSWFVRKYLLASKDLGGCFKMNCFVLRDTVSVVLRNLSELLVIECCSLLEDLIEIYLDTLNAEIQAILPDIVNTLVSWAKYPVVLDFLKFLVVVKRSELKEAVERLDPFPNEPEFEGMLLPNVVGGLKDELKRFSLRIGGKGRRVGGLVRLEKALETHKEELKKIYEEDGNLVRDVVQQLVQLCGHKEIEVSCILLFYLDSFYGEVYRDFV